MTDIPADLAQLGWTRRGSQLFAPPEDPQISICMNTFPPPACYDMARDQPRLRAEIRARMEGMKKPKPKPKPKKARKPRPEKKAEPVLTQEVMQL